MKTISIILPCYNNGTTLPFLFEELLKLKLELPSDTVMEMIFVDDRSTDDTHAKLLHFREHHSGRMVIIRLARNVGIFNAIICGLENSTGDCATVVTADLQDPPELVLRLYEHWRNGQKLVFTVRQERHDPLIDRIFASFYHFLVRQLALPNAPKQGYGVALVDRQIINELLRIRERHTNPLLQLLALGYDHVVVPYTRPGRITGHSTWTFAKKTKLFVDTFVSFSYVPIRLITLSGFLLGTLGIVYATFILIAGLSGMAVVKGWSALMIVVLIIGSFQMVALGILGEYLWRTLDTVRGRPTYVIEQRTEHHTL
jgi:dolichol-phosphate mannosyltransferase